MIETIHIVQPFDAVRGHLMPRLPIQLPTSTDAAERAGRIADDHAGVIAYTMQIDEEGGDYSDPIVIFKAGDVPELG